jgi:ABC-2 type transport system ATP-binding protein
MSQVMREKAAEGIPVLFSSHQLDLVERLCDRVGIVRSGQMVAVGPVDELRATGPRRLVVDAPKAPPGWADGLAGVRVLDHDAGRTELELDDGADDQAVLRAALTTGPVRRFGDRRPSLAELYRHVVTDDAGTENAA